MKYPVLSYWLEKAQIKSVIFFILVHLCDWQQPSQTATCKYRKTDKLSKSSI